MTARFRSKSIAEAAPGVVRAVGALGVFLLSTAAMAGTPPQTQAPAPAQPAGQGAAQAPAQSPAPAGAENGVAPPPGYVIGPEDVLEIVYWRDKDMTAQVAVRPDGKISLPLVNDIQAAGLTPVELRERLVEASRRFIEDPSVTVVVKQINSRKVFITGEINKPGPYALVAPTTVLQLIAMAGGLKDFADSKNIVIVRTENGHPVTYAFNYKSVASRKNLRQNIELKPGDTVVVP